MTFVSAKGLRRLATNPRDYVRFVTTGRVPQGVRPQGALVDLLKALDARDLAGLLGVTVGKSLGYEGSRTFATGLQALQWVAPSAEVFESFPAEAWRIKGFKRRLTLDELIACCKQAPEALHRRYPQLV